MQPDEFKRIIHDVHDKLASVYGPLSIRGQLEQNTLEHWNYLTNLKQPVSDIVQRYVRNLPFTLLDAGCGNGQLFHLYFQLGAKVIYGVDFSINMLQQATHRATINHIPFVPVRSDLENLPFTSDGKFELINCYGVIEHLANPQKVVGELIRVLSSQGHLIIGIPRRGSLAWLTYLLFHESLERVITTAIPSGYPAWRRKMTFYRFFSERDIQLLFSSLRDTKLIDRIPIAWGGILRPVSRILEKIAQQGRYDLIDRWNHLARKSGIIPAGEYFVLQKQ